MSSTAAWLHCSTSLHDPGTNTTSSMILVVVQRQGASQQPQQQLQQHAPMSSCKHSPLCKYTYSIRNNRTCEIGTCLRHNAHAIMPTQKGHLHLFDSICAPSCDCVYVSRVDRHILHADKHLPPMQSCRSRGRDDICYFCSSACLVTLHLSWSQTFIGMCCERYRICSDRVEEVRIG